VLDAPCLGKPRPRTRSGASLEDFKQKSGVDVRTFTVTAGMVTVARIERVWG
jgi:hypothetical protein